MDKDQRRRDGNTEEKHEVRWRIGEAHLPDRPQSYFRGTDAPELIREWQVPAGVRFAALVDRELAAVGDMLKAKNAAYGNSALDPIRIFAQADAVEQINVRIDDKLSRIKRGHAAGEDVTFDLIGYLVLLRIARATEKQPT